MYRTRQKIEDTFDYTKLRDGSWQIEFRGFTEVTAREKTLRACQARAIEEIDAKLAEFVVTPAATRRANRIRRARR